MTRVEVKKNWPLSAFYSISDSSALVSIELKMEPESEAFWLAVSYHLVALRVFRLFEEFPGVKAERGGADTDAGAPLTFSPESTFLSSLLRLSSRGDRHKSLPQTNILWSLHHSPSLSSASVHPEDRLFIWSASPEIRRPNKRSCCSPPSLQIFRLFLFPFCVFSLCFFMYVTADSRRTEDE